MALYVAGHIESILAASNPPLEHRHGARGTLYVQTTGHIISSRLYDIGYSIDLRATRTLLDAAVQGYSAAASASLTAPNPPVTVSLGTLDVDGKTAKLSARIYPFGTVALRLRLELPRTYAWPEYVAECLRLSPILREPRWFEPALDNLRSRLAPAIARPHLAPVSEDYLIFRPTSLLDGKALVPALALTNDHLEGLLLAESRPVTPEARAALIGSRWSYYPDELAMFTWDQAVVIAQGEDETDVETFLELANAQLLELRVYDNLLDGAVTRMYDVRERLARQSGIRRLFSRWEGLISEVQTNVADISEVVEHVENALRFTDDVYLARVYQAALETFRVRTWRASVDRKLKLMQDTASMLNDASATGRSEFMELTIVALILIEIVISIFR